MAKIFFGIGSNINPRENIFLALNEIKSKFTKIKISPVYQNKSAGFEGEDFLKAAYRELEEETSINNVELIKEIDGNKHEPMETLVIDVPADFSGKAIELVTQKKGDMLVMEPKGDLQHLEFDIPSRGLIGLRNNILTATAGNAIMTHRFREYAQFKGDITERMKGSLISMESGKSTAFSIGKLQDLSLIHI